MMGISRKASVAAIAVAASLAAFGTAVAAIPAPDGTIHSCYDAQGALRIVDETAACPAGSTKLTFNQKGFRYRGTWKLETDKAGQYAIGDVVYFSRTDCWAHGSYVKDHQVQYIYPQTPGYCAANGWKRLAVDGQQGPAGPQGPQGPPGPVNVHWARVDETGKLTAQSGGSVQVSDAGVGLTWVHFGVTNANACAATITPIVSGGGTVTASRYRSGDGPWVLVTTTHQDRKIDTGFDITLNC